MSFRIMHNILILIVSFETLLQISKFTNANYATKKFLCKTFIIMQFKCIIPYKTVKSLLTTMVQKLLSKQALQKGAQKMCEKFPLNAPFSSFFKLPLLFCLKYFLHPSTHSMLHTWQILTPASSDLPQTFIPLSLYQKHTPCSSTDMKSLFLGINFIRHFSMKEE